MFYQKCTDYLTVNDLKDDDQRSVLVSAQNEHPEALQRGQEGQNQHVFTIKTKGNKCLQTLEPTQVCSSMILGLLLSQQYNFCFDPCSLPRHQDLDNFAGRWSYQPQTFSSPSTKSSFCCISSEIRRITLYCLPTKACG